ncbi:MAG: hypothetical protein WD036_04780 [Bauldia sp.]
MLNLVKPCLVAAVLGGLTAPVAAEPLVCGAHETIVGALAEQYKEERQSMGLSSSGHLVEVFVSGGGTWTILLTTKAGLACIVASGLRWNGLTPTVVGGPAA